ncbi:MAG: hypothetical protein O2979_12025 [Proteobacteria bacterium]|nr:hypothetical protein [Pseudomonadota bacterium]
MDWQRTPPVAYIWREVGESEQAAIKREGIKPGQDVVVCSWEEETAIPSRIGEKVV